MTPSSDFPRRSIVSPQFVLLWGGAVAFYLSFYLLVVCRRVVRWLAEQARSAGEFPGQLILWKNVAGAGTATEKAFMSPTL